MECARRCYELGQQVYSVEHKLEVLLKTIETTFLETNNLLLPMMVEDCKTLLKKMKEKNKQIKTNIGCYKFEQFYQVILEVIDLESDYLNVYRNYLDCLQYK